MMRIEIITTSDGSHSLRNHELNETYHSIHGAMQESVHVFINKGLDHFIEENPAQPEINILEVGFGTGLNALLTLERAKTILSKINYTSLEVYPIPSETWMSLNYARNEETRAGFQKLHQAEWDTFVAIEPNFTLRKVNQSLEDATFQAASYDVIYYDAFAPNKQPEMWTAAILAKVVKLIRPGGIFVTYCAKGQLKRDLKALDLAISTLDGPPGKKEMVRGKKM
jgi:tRNA U34 5-methylaminomethyl-2-thiouridine-forming methyltransferase MnmC